MVADQTSKNAVNPLLNPEVEAALAPVVLATDGGDYRRAARLLEQLLVDHAQANPVLHATCLGLLALCQVRLDHGETAIDFATQALAMFEQQSDHASQSQAHCTLVVAFAKVGLYRDALEHAFKAQRSADAAGQTILLCWALNRTGVAYAALKDWPNAIANSERALVLARQLGDLEALFACLNNLGFHHVGNAESVEAVGEVAQARACIARARAPLEEAVQVARQSASLHRECVALSNVCEVMIHQEEFDAAAQLIDQYQQVARAHGYESVELMGDFATVNLLRRQARHEVALARLDQMRQHPSMKWDSVSRLRLLKAAYEAHKAISQFEQALDFLEQHAALDKAMLQRIADVQSRVLVGRLRVEQAELAAEQASLEAQRQRMLAAQLTQEQSLLRSQALQWGREAREDALTGLGNRRVVDEVLPGLLQQAHDEQLPLSVAMVDLDHFKKVNDSHGHAVGDQVLVVMGQLLRANTRGADVLARVGGEEFMVVLVGTAIDRAQEICERLREAVARHDWSACAPGLRVTISVGLVDRTSEHDSLRLVERADRALYVAKKQGRNRVVPM